MKHPSREILALQSAGDLGLLERWRTVRHLKGCPTCRDEVAAFADMREILPELNQIPEVSWNRIAGEMRANIRLGLAAGECVRESSPIVPASPLFGAARATLAFAGVMATLLVGLVLERPTPSASTDPVVQATAHGVQRRAGDRSFGLMNSASDGKVTYSVDAQGSLGARYVDSETGNVTMTKVYVE
jgi:hypothetical protein